MNDEKLFELVRGVDPLLAGAEVDEPEAVLARVLASARRQEPVRRQPQRRKRFVLAAAVVLAAACTGLAVAATGWLSGSPAPSAVVTDFEAYTPQLGFHPNPGGAVLVAADGAIRLYATTNQEGSYCLAVTSPWKSAQMLDGGTCVPSGIASAHFVAGNLGGAAPDRESGHTTLVVGGRIADPAARTIRFVSPDGRLVSRRVGSSGFFIAGVAAPAQPCAGGNWTSTFTALDAGGNEIAQATIPLMRDVEEAVQGRNAHVCVFSFLRP